jgi:TetR/AcrR family transcriptional regulator
VAKRAGIRVGTSRTQGAARPARPARPTRPARTVRSTADRILDVAEAQFARRGYDGTSLGDIALGVRVKVPSLYKHFAGKKALYAAVLERLLDPYLELLHRVLTVPDDADAAEHNVEAVVTHYLETPNLARLVQHAALAGGAPLRVLVDRWYAPLFARAAELSAPAGDAAVAMVIAFHSMMSGYVTMAPLHGRLLGRDMLAADAMAAQRALMRGLARSMWG